MSFSTIATEVQGCVWSLKMLAWISMGICIDHCWFCFFSKVYSVFNFVVDLLGFCLFGMHVILLTCQVGAAAFSSHCLCMEFPWAALARILWHHEETLFFSRTAGPLGQVPQILSFRFLIQPDLKPYTAQTVPLLRKGLVEPFQFQRQRCRSPCSRGPDKKRVVQAGAGIQ